MQNPTNKTFIQKLKALKQTVRFSAEQKNMMRSTLGEYADMHTVINTGGAPQARSVPSPFISFFFSRGFVAAVLILVLVGGSGVGVTYAAGNSLPGQPLYGVKVNVAEPIEGALIPTTEGKAQWQNVLAERRLSEATTLAAENNLSTSTQTYLEQQASVHIQASEQDSAKLADAGNANGALAVQSDLEARISAHVQLLAMLDTRLQANGDATTTGEVATLIQNVNQANRTIALNREASEHVTASSTPSGRAKIAFDAQQDTARHSEETTLLAQNESILALLPEASSTASSTATTTPRRNHHRNPQGTATTTTETIASTTASTTTSGGINIQL